MIRFVDEHKDRSRVEPIIEACVAPMRGSCRCRATTPRGKSPPSARSVADAALCEHISAVHEEATACTASQDAPGAANTRDEDQTNGCLVISVHDAGPADGVGRLTDLRREFHRCLTARADALFELTDALLCGDAPVRSLVELSLVGEHPRGLGSPTRIVDTDLATSIRSAPLNSINKVS
jgi:hypothetical protein